MSRSVSELSHYLIIGDASDRRVRLFQEALSRLGHPVAEVVSYQSLLQAGGDISQWLTPAHTHLRIESPGAFYEVFCELVAWGAEAAFAQEEVFARISPEEARQMVPAYGQIFYPYQWFLGFRRLLEALECSLLASGWQGVQSAPQMLSLMFDKWAASTQMSGAGVRTTRLLGTPQSYEELLSLMEESQCRRVFVKLRTGSSASGVVAFRRHPQGNRQEAVTSVELVEGEDLLYNSLQIRRYRSQQEVRRLFDLLCHQGVIVEEWTPKARTQGAVYDLRVVVIDGAVKHRVVRLGRSPMTNLHLGNQRGDIESLRGSLDAEVWEALEGQARLAWEAFPGVWMVGVDVLLTSGSMTPVVIEANAFGDLLPGVIVEGHDTYGAQIMAQQGR